MTNNLYELINKNIVDGSNVKIATKKFSLRAFYKLIHLFKKCNSIKILLTDFNNYQEINKELTRIYEINHKEKEALTNFYHLFS